MTQERERFENGERALDFLERRGYRRCDMPACNCNSWHQGHAEARLAEIRDALEEGHVDLNGKTTLQAVRDLQARAALDAGAVEALRGLLAKADAAMTAADKIDTVYEVGGWGPALRNYHKARTAYLDAALAAIPAGSAGEGK